MTDSTLIEIGALWEQETKDGRVYMSGKLGDSHHARLVLFPNDSENPKAPNWRVYITPGKKRENGNGGNSQRPQQRQAPAQKPQPAAEPDYDDIPF